MIEFISYDPLKSLYLKFNYNLFMINIFLKQSSTAYHSLINYIHRPWTHELTVVFFKYLKIYGNRFTNFWCCKNLSKSLNQHIEILGSNLNVDLRMMALREIILMAEYFHLKEGEAALVLAYFKTLPEEEKEALNQFDDEIQVEGLNEDGFAELNEFEKRILIYLSQPKVENSKLLLDQLHKRLLKISLIYKAKKLTINELNNRESEVEDVLDRIKMDLALHHEVLFLAYRVKKFYQSLMEARIFKPSLLNKIRSIIIV